MRSPVATSAINFFVASFRPGHVCGISTQGTPSSTSDVDISRELYLSKQTSWTWNISRQYLMRALIRLLSITRPSQVSIQPSSTHRSYGIPSCTCRFLSVATGIQQNGRTSYPPSPRGNTAATADKSVVIEISTPTQHLRLINRASRSCGNGHPDA